jgi:hypothetical protein
MNHLLSTQEYNGIRDVRDAKEASNVHFDRLANLRRFLSKKSHASSTGVRGSAAPGCPSGISSSPDGGIVQTHRGPKCATPACADILGFNTLDVANFPVAGGGLGVVTNTNAITISSGNASAYKATQFFFEGRDAAAGLANVPCLLADVAVSGIAQLVDNGGTSGITSAVFALTNEPLYVGWDAFMDRGAKQLTLTFANILAAAVTLEIFGVLWGSRAD